MSADELRQAAETLRARAEDANQGPWASDHNAVRRGRDALALTFDIRFGNDTDQTGKDATYIATMHPGVGLALADWLDKAADLCASGNSSPSRRGLGYEQAVTVARLINGGV